VIGQSHARTRKRVKEGETDVKAKGDSMIQSKGRLMLDWKRLFALSSRSNEALDCAQSACPKLCGKESLS
jgi:hypothetical protein